MIEFSNFLLQLKTKGLGKTVRGFFYYFERNYDVLKSKSPCFRLNKNISFNKNKAELKMGNPKHPFREMNLVLRLVYESGIISKTVMSWSSRKKKECIFRNVYRSFNEYLA